MFRVFRKIPVMAAVVLAGCVTGGQSDTTGSGPIELSVRIQNKFEEYLDNNPAVFVVAEDGRSSYNYYYCPEIRCRGTNHSSISKAILGCEKYSNGVPCKVYAIGQEIVWRGADGSPQVRTDDLPNTQELPTAGVDYDLKVLQRQMLVEYNENLFDYPDSMGAFAVAVSGYQSSWGRFAKDGGAEKTLKLAANQAIDSCEARAGVECMLFAVNHQVVATGQSIDEYLGPN